MRARLQWRSPGFRWMARRALPGLVALGVLGACTTGPDDAEFLRRVAWADSGVWLKADTHTHTEFSDGSETVATVVRQAAAHGCDVIAITDHTDLHLEAATPEYFDAVERARREHPDLIVLAGVEWNVPPFDGDKHATVLLPPSNRSGAILSELKRRYDDWERPLDGPALSVEALMWLDEQVPPGGIQPLVLYNHPSRKDSAAVDNLSHLARWRNAVPDVFVGFSGAPGHQGDDPIGSYEHSIRTRDRWDPAVAEVGGLWDQLLSRGMDLWAARAPSDFHTENEDGLDDFLPGEFSETWLYAPDRSVEGALRALRAGTFFASHGHIAREVDLRVDARGLHRAAVAGESVRAPAGAEITVSLDMEVPARDWRGEPNRVDSVELIVISQGRARVAYRREPGGPEAGPAFRETLTVPPGGLVVRARGRRAEGDGPDLLFYTNPIRIRTDSQP